MEFAKEIFQVLEQILNYSLFRAGNSEVTVKSLLLVILLMALLVIITSQMRRLLENKILGRYNLDIGLRKAIGSLFKYLFFLVGSIIIISSAGIDLSVLTVLIGTLGLGIGFGLQSIFSNFISGIIILFERPIKVGDRIEVGGTNGDVIKIAIRATTILTNDGIAIIVPNSDFITREVINWSYSQRQLRFRIPVGVAHGSDVKMVEKLLLEVAAENENVLSEPASVVRFMAFGESALKFELRIWTTSLIHRQGKITSELNFAIYEKFKQHNIKIPFAQLDLHVKNEDGNGQ